MHTHVRSNLTAGIRNYCSIDLFLPPPPSHLCSSLSPTQSVNAASEGEREESLASSSLSEHPVARGSVISPPVSAAAPRWSSTKPRSPPESKIPIPQSMGRRGFPQRSSPKADSPGQVEDLEQALVTQTKMADLKKAHQEELDRYEYICSCGCIVHHSHTQCIRYLCSFTV